MSTDPALGAPGVSPACAQDRCGDCWGDWLDDAAEALRPCDHNCHPEDGWVYLPAAGHAAIVGEQGPEVFVPASPPMFASDSDFLRQVLEAAEDAFTQFRAVGVIGRRDLRRVRRSLRAAHARLAGRAQWHEDPTASAVHAAYDRRRRARRRRTRR